jgi:hypothetical protein
MIREDLIDDFAQTYPSPEPPGARPTAFLHCTRGPLAFEPAGATRERDEKLAGYALARPVLFAVMPSFVQLLTPLPLPFLAAGLIFFVLVSFAEFLRAFLNDWPLRGGETLGLLAAFFACFVLTSRWGLPELGLLAVLLPGLIGLNWFSVSLAREFARYVVHARLLEEEAASVLDAASGRLRLPDPGIIAASVAALLALEFGFPFLALAVLVAVLWIVSLYHGAATVPATKEALVRFFSYNDHECYSPFVFQFEEPFRTPAARRAILPPLMMLVGCGLAAAVNRPVALGTQVLADSVCFWSARCDAAWAAVFPELAAWALRTALIAACAYPILILSVAASAGPSLALSHQTLKEVEA